MIVIVTKPVFCVLYVVGSEAQEALSKRDSVLCKVEV